ncbi:hypothetical protein RND81_10G080200 [Saponaria officinalis]|uniref:Glutaredoxin domain-containing protein n=1 Tax=Saponaria officinalis TaxID=3572 RepID=A0AAW1HZD0_SAPOF
MAETYNSNNNINNHRELSTTKAISALKPSAFNRSMTISATSATSHFSKRSSFLSPSDRNVSTTYDRNVSAKKWYESAGSSFKGKVKQLRTLFETPKTLNYSSSINNCSINEEDELGQTTKTSSYNHLQHHGAFARLRPVKSISTDFKDCWSILDASTIRFPGTEDRVVVYFTSLRGIRRTFEDCYAVRMIFRGFHVFVDERDVSMDIAYRKELQELLKDEKNVSLPQVFIKGKYVGGVDMIRQLNETGDLRKILQVLPVKDRRFVCEACGDVRFMPCSNCSGSRKVFDEDEGVAKRCLECNENGLIRCPQCCL